MCEYCELKPSTDSMIKFGRCFDDLEYEGEMYITQFEDGQYALMYWDKQMGEENYAPIKFCPMCGRSLCDNNVETHSLVPEFKNAKNIDECSRCKIRNICKDYGDGGVLTCTELYQELLQTDRIKSNEE